MTGPQGPLLHAVGHGGRVPTMEIGKSVPLVLLTSQQRFGCCFLPAHHCPQGLASWSSWTKPPCSPAQASRWHLFSPLASRSVLGQLLAGLSLCKQWASASRRPRQRWGHLATGAPGLTPASTWSRPSCSYCLSHWHAGAICHGHSEAISASDFFLLTLFSPWFSYLPFLHFNCVSLYLWKQKQGINFNEHLLYAFRVPVHLICKPAPLYRWE